MLDDSELHAIENDVMSPLTFTHGVKGFTMEAFQRFINRYILNFVSNHVDSLDIRRILNLYNENMGSGLVA